MRAFQVYRFLIPAKVPFATWPEIAQQFFRQQGLSYGRFHYYFEELHIDGYRNGCELAAKENPCLGPVKLREASQSNWFHCVLTNMYAEPGCQEGDIMPLMGKIYRRYGFGDTYLIYQDIDFFGEAIPAIEYPLRENVDRFYGSSLILHRDGVFRRWSGMDLRVEILRDGQFLDAACYRDALGTLLPGVRASGYMEVCLTPEEEAFYARQQETAKPMVQKAQAFLEAKMRETVAGIQLPPGATLAATLKKLCKSYGFTYVGYHYRIYFIEKRTDRGHYLSLEVDTGRTGEEVNPRVEYKGAGFSLRLYTPREDPKGMGPADYLERLFAALLAAEKTMLQPLAEHFPETPDWFRP